MLRDELRATSLACAFERGPARTAASVPGCSLGAREPSFFDFLLPRDLPERDRARSKRGLARGAGHDASRASSSPVLPRTDDPPLSPPPDGHEIPLLGAHGWRRRNRFSVTWDAEFACEVTEL